MSGLEAHLERFLLRPTRAFPVGVSLVGAVLVMALVVSTEPLGIDQRWSEAMLDIRTSPLTDLALVFNWVARGLGWVLPLAAVATVLFARRRWVALIAFAVTKTVTPLSSTQVHWLSDVIGGSLLGVGVALTTFAGLQLMNSRSVGRTRETSEEIWITLRTKPRLASQHNIPTPGSRRDAAPQR